MNKQDQTQLDTVKRFLEGNKNPILKPNYLPRKMAEFLLHQLDLHMKVVKASSHFEKRDCNHGDYYEDDRICCTTCSDLVCQALKEVDGG